MRSPTTLEVRVTKTTTTNGNISFQQKTPNPTMLIVFLIAGNLLFISYNLLIGNIIVDNLTQLFREGSERNGEDLCRLRIICPIYLLALFGFITPYILGILILGNILGIGMLIVSGVLPYLCCIIKFCFYDDRKKTEKYLICKEVIGEDSINRRHQDSSDEQQDWTISFTLKHPKSDIVLKRKKKLDVNDNDSNNNNNEAQNISSHHDEESIYPIPLASNEKNSDCNKSISNTGNCEQDNESVCYSEVISGSIQECNICLEEYKVGDKIGWSYNDKCNHVFHKACIIEWLLEHENCPICRNKY